MSKHANDIYTNFDTSYLTVCYGGSVYNLMQDPEIFTPDKGLGRVASEGVYYQYATAEAVDTYGGRVNIVFEACRDLDDEPAEDGETVARDAMDYGYVTINPDF